MPSGRPKLNLTAEERQQHFKQQKQRYGDTNFTYRRLAKNLQAQTESYKRKRRERYHMKTIQEQSMKPDF